MVSQKEMTRALQENKLLRAKIKIAEKEMKSLEKEWKEAKSKKYWK